MKVFISHTKRDEDRKSRNLAKELCIFLERKGIDAVFDEFTFIPGKPLLETIFEHIDSSDKFLFICSLKSLTSNYVCKELQFARYKDLQSHPNNFIHVVDIEDEQSFEHVPKDFQSLLIHKAAHKSKLKLFYEIYFSLKGVSLSENIRAELRASPENPWFILDKEEIIEIMNNEGDTRIEVRYVVRNLSVDPKKYGHDINFWLENGNEITIPDVKAFNFSQDPLEVTPKLHDRRGIKTLTFKIDYPESITPDEVCGFILKFEQKAGVDIFTGDTYTIDCEEKSYGRYRFDLHMPRNLEIDYMFVERHDSNGMEKMPVGQLGINRFSKILDAPHVGSRHIFKFKAKKLNPPGPLRPITI